MSWKLFLTTVTFTAIAIAQTGEVSIRVSEDARTVSVSSHVLSKRVPVDSQTQIELLTLAQEKIKLLKGNTVAYNSVVQGMLFEITADGERIAKAIEESEGTLVKVSKKQMTALRKKFKALKALQDRNDRNKAYLRALLACMEYSPVSNETLKVSTMGIQSRWCQDMKNSDDGRMVAMYLVGHAYQNSKSLAETFGDHDAIDLAISDLYTIGAIQGKK